eukprot:21252-Lingulodinium_polyedra.AAC.1
MAAAPNEKPPARAASAKARSGAPGAACAAMARMDARARAGSPAAAPAAPDRRMPARMAPRAATARRTW